MILLILACSVLVVYLLQMAQLLSWLRYISAFEALLCALFFTFEAFQSTVPWRSKSKLLLSALPFLCVLLVIIPFSSYPSPYLLPQDATDAVLNAISTFWEEACGSLLLCLMTVFAFKVQKFHSEIASIHE
ncbi:hypothetical protein [Dictyobacter arantiisoli]|uniref:hypothetical protein n=1 Tax=Dictyobacter arantiisoli TaxID=2014874 RepID=UPI0011EF4985|nr:hypothetical protein [Dictyobacter arantiisoli]